MVTQQSRWSTSSAASALNQPTEIVREYPLSSMLVVFGIGLGVGVLLSQAIAEPVSRAFSHEPTMREKLGRQVYSALHSVMPDSLAQRMNM